jgi:hypothetical protein
MKGVVRELMTVLDAIEQCRTILERHNLMRASRRMSNAVPLIETRIREHQLHAIKRRTQSQPANE